MAQLDVVTYMSQIFWLVITLSVLFMVMGSEGGIVEKVSKVLKVRSMRLSTKKERESSSSIGESKGKKLIEILKM